MFFFQFTRFSLHSATEEFLAFIKATVYAFKFDIALSEILLTASADQLSIQLNYIRYERN